MAIGAAESDHIPNPAATRARVDRLAWERDRLLEDSGATAAELAGVQAYLGVAADVTKGLDHLSKTLFETTLSVVEEQLTLALQEILEQPIRLRADPDFKRGAATVDFYIERDGNREHILRGQGGSVANVLSVGLRMFALTTLDEGKHRRFLVLDEQDCWLKPELVPRLVKMVHDAGKALGFQVLMISHHDPEPFHRYADRVYRLVPGGEDGVSVERLDVAPHSLDPDQPPPGRATP